MKISKNLIIGIILVAALAIGYYLYNKSQTPDLSALPPTPTPFEADDQAAYDSALADFEAAYPGVNAWMGPIVAKAYKDGTFKINGKPSKTASFIRVMGQVAPQPNLLKNPTTGLFEDKKTHNVSTLKGLSIDKYGNVSLFTQDFSDKMWNNYLIPLQEKYSTL